ncbi:type IVB secretion system protein IcmH/DotU [Martelella alba]|uniref:Type VI secretion system protein TssL n=1 Tax=Martelella alba TaxID=2590451 RepID=A0ABY2SHW7_9HYPH|nr:type IVB secretion system protein IcmH/DotU [Martelella alba]TKI04330.1 type VI secretion system protein TssL [Martelella alba]
MNDPAVLPPSCAGQDNPLVFCALPLLNAIAHLRYAPAPAEPAALRQSLVNEVRRFEKHCQSRGLTHDVIVGSRYCLCTALDEAAALTDWGKSDIWTGNGLLLAFHNETSGGEKFFQLMATLSQDPARHVDLLELMYFCLLLGFGGRYRVMENGIYRLEIITQRLARQLRTIRGDYPAPLSHFETVIEAPRRGARLGTALLLCLLLGGLGASTLHILLDQRLDTVANRVQERLFALALPKAPPPLAGFSLDTLRRRFKDEIAAGNLSVAVQGDRVVVSLCGGDVFPSASAHINRRYEPLIGQLAELMAMIQGTVTVRGYSDGQPIRTPAYASNQALSLARAEAVAELLRQSPRRPRRVVAESAEGQLLPNTSRRNRAINRRVSLSFHNRPPVAAGSKE